MDEDGERNWRRPDLTMFSVAVALLTFQGTVLVTMPGIGLLLWQSQWKVGSYNTSIAAWLTVFCLVRKRANTLAQTVQSHAKSLLGFFWAEASTTAPNSPGTAHITMLESLTPARKDAILVWSARYNLSYRIAFSHT